MSLLILKPKKNYDKVAEIFQEMYEKVTDIKLEIKTEDDEKSDLVVIGTDAVNDFMMKEVLDCRIESLNIRYSSDDYCIKTYKKDGRNILCLAGGRLRSTMYAVYDYFERFADCHYFWDGDVIPHKNSLPTENIDIVEVPRFEFRGLRYFAHRGLKRFQAEHWSFDDWKKEIDWMIKKRFNFFMIRIGMDDVWQRAFPDDVPYPDGFYSVKGADLEGYNDRSDFWTLKYRGKLRENILEYIRENDMISPVDCGTMTHWYSRTPIEFLESRKPTFLTQEIAHYTASDTGKVFDFTKEENMDYYMKLTETMVDEYDKSTAFFHTIGLGERQMYTDKAKNFALKKLAYRKISENINRRYPDSKLLIASWDFLGLWTPDEVQELVAEFDPEKTIFFDYTSEGNDPDNSFLNWGVVGKFPWIFGLFHAYQSESELRGPYDRSDERLKVAKDDPYCKGMVFWPELAHSDPIILEYLADNSWSPLENNVEQIVEKFCKNRYGTFADKMNECWQTILPFIKLGDWGGHSRRDKEDEKFIEYYPSWYTHQDIWPKVLKFLRKKHIEDKALEEYFKFKIAKTLPEIKNIIKSLNILADNPDALRNEFILRDGVDMARTALSRFMNFFIMQSLANKGNADYVKKLKEKYLGLTDNLTEVLSLNTDFSLYHSLKELEKVAPTNPDFEATLKRNINNEYCSQAAFELVVGVCRKEGEVAFDWMMNAGDEIPDFNVVREKITEDFMITPLEKLQPVISSQPEKVFAKVADSLKNIKEFF